MKTRFPRLRAVLGGLPLVTLAAASGAAWRYFLSGGFRSILGWYALLTAVPLLALVVFAGTLFRTARTQRKPGRLVATTVLAGFCLWPAGWNFGALPIAFPYDL